MHMLVPVPVVLIAPYTEAAELLRPILGKTAPTPSDLVATGMTNRRAEAIAEEYLEFNGLPTLATCRMRQRLRRSLTGKIRHSGRVAVALLPPTQESGATDSGRSVREHSRKSGRPKNCTS
jgi:hypothetical protein